jgi:hypothetical protein
VSVLNRSTGWCSGNALDFFSIGVPFSTRPGRRLCWSSVVFFCQFWEIPWQYLKFAMIASVCVIPS